MGVEREERREERRERGERERERESGDKYSEKESPKHNPKEKQSTLTLTQTQNSRKKIQNNPQKSTHDPLPPRTYLCQVIETRPLLSNSILLNGVH